MRCTHTSSRTAASSPSTPGAEAISPDDLLEIPCDVFIPAALGGMIHAGNADRLRCRLIIEGANSPTTPQADEILHEKGVFIIPDVMANAGGVVVSYFEWVQNLQHFRWDEREVNDRLGTILRRAYREVVARAREQGDEVPLRVAAYEVGIERVLEAARTRGYIPAAAERLRLTREGAPFQGRPVRPCPPWQVRARRLSVSTVPGRVVGRPARRAVSGTPMPRTGVQAWREIHPNRGGQRPCAQPRRGGSAASTRSRRSGPAPRHRARRSRARALRPGGCAPGA